MRAPSTAAHIWEGTIMPWVNPPVGGNGADGHDAFSKKKIIRRPVKPQRGNGSNKKRRVRSKEPGAKRAGRNGGSKPPANVYVFEARIVRHGEIYLIYVFKWPRPCNGTVPLDGVRTNLLNDEIV